MTPETYVHNFANGLTLVAEPIASLESAAFSILVPAGCAYDPPDRLGLGAVLCEMLLRGSGNRDSRKFVQDLDSLGVERGDSTSAAHISYSGATLARNLLPALEIYADLLRRPHLPENQVNATRQVVLQELQSIEDEPSQKVMLELRKRQYPDAWGRSSHGEQAHVEAIQHTDIQAQYTRRFGPQNVILGVAGRFDWNKLLGCVGELFADWESPPRTTEPPFGQRVQSVEHIEHESNQTQIGIAYTSVPYSHRDYFQAWGAVGVLSGGMSSRLFTEVREKRGLCYTVYASQHTLRNRGAVLCYAGTSADRAQETLDVTLDELRRLRLGVQASELNRLKARIKSSLIMQQESSAARSGAIARDWYHLGKVRSLDEISRLVDELSCDSINAYLAANPPGDFIVVTLGQQPLKVA